MSDSSIWRAKKAIGGGNIDDVFALGRGSGRPGKAKGVESEIIEKVERNNYQTRQQVADMIHEKFGITMSVSAVGKLLKKRHQAAEKRLYTRKSGCSGTAIVP